MRRGGLFRRFFTTIAAAILVTVLIFTFTTTTSMRQIRQNNFENEVRLQASEIADYMENLDRLSAVSGNVTMQYVIRRKIADIQRRYNADIWIVSYNSGTATVLDGSWNTSEGIFNDSVTEQLRRIQRGEEIRVTGLFPELGDHIVTIGVPWTYADGTVVGAVLLHISNERLRIDLREVLGQILPPALLALLAGLALSALLTRSQIRPLRELDNAVREFTKGDLDRRVDLHCGGELEDLGHSINRMAEELSQLEDSRRHFVAAVSHELRSPLTCIRGYIEALQDGVIPPEEMHAYLRIVMDETDRLTALVHDLLDMSRLESGRFPLEPAPFDVNEVIRHVLINYEPRIEDKRIEVKTLFTSERCPVTGDSGRITQVISNLVDNALKFLPEGGRLTVGTEPKGREVRIFTANNGPAIDGRDLPHIFDRFYKADKAHTSGGGTGLGLAICRMIVQEHGSQISVTSVPGNTCFEFTLPACAPEALAPAAEAPAASKPQ